MAALLGIIACHLVFGVKAGTVLAMLISKWRVVSTTGEAIVLPN